MGKKTSNLRRIIPKTILKRIQLHQNQSKHTQPRPANKTQLRTQPIPLKILQNRPHNPKKQNRILPRLFRIPPRRPSHPNKIPNHLPKKRRIIRKPMLLQMESLPKSPRRSQNSLKQQYQNNPKTASIYPKTDPKPPRQRRTTYRPVPNVPKPVLSPHKALMLLQYNLQPLSPLR